MIIYCFTSRSKIFHLYRDVTIAGEGLHNLVLCSARRAGVTKRSDPRRVLTPGSTLIIAQRKGLRRFSEGLGVIAKYIPLLNVTSQYIFMTFYAVWGGVFWLASQCLIMIINNNNDNNSSKINMPMK